MFKILKGRGLPVRRPPFLNVEYEESFDMMLYKDIGYEKLSILVSNLFYSPYGATSLREYFANGFGAYFYYKDVAHLKKISPFLLEKLQELYYYSTEGVKK